MRASPSGTTGKENATAYTPQSRRRAASICARTASPIIMGTMGCESPLTTKPASQTARRNQAVLRRSRSQEAQQEGHGTRRDRLLEALGRILGTEEADDRRQEGHRAGDQGGNGLVRLRRIDASDQVTLKGTESGNREDGRP